MYTGPQVQNVWKTPTRSFICSFSCFARVTFINQTSFLYVYALLDKPIYRNGSMLLSFVSLKNEHVWSTQVWSIHNSEEGLEKAET